MTAAPVRPSLIGLPRPTPARDEGGQAGGGLRWLPLAAACVLFGGGLALFWLPLRAIDLGAMDGLGLISALPVASLAGLALVAASFVVLLARARPATALMAVILVGVVFCLDGVTAIVEPLPRFPTAYQIAGFVNYVSQTGHVEPSLAAYFSWPGFFTLIAFVTSAAGVHSLLPLMTWWPVVIDTLLLVPFLLLTRALRINWRARWLGALLLCIGNWVGQDYFSPQSFNFLLYLVFLAILLVWFGSPAWSSGHRADLALNGVSRVRPAGVSRVRSAGVSRERPAGVSRERPAGVSRERPAGVSRVRSALRLPAASHTPGELPARQVATPIRGILLLLLILIFAASTLSHQLTPFLMIVTCAGLVLVGRCWPRGLPALFAVILVGWISYGAVGYWSGHASVIFGNLGELSGTFSASVSGRVIGTPIHQWADKSRIGLAALMVLLALGGLARRWRGGVTDRALIVAFVAPLTIAGLQNYGGEIALRIYMFALPAIAVLAACLFFPGTDRAARLAGRSGQRTGRLRAAGLGVGGIIAGGTGPGQAGAHGASVVETPGAIDRPAGRLPAWMSVAAAGVVVAGLSGVFMVARYGNEAFERTPPSEYAAMNYIYDHAGSGTAVLWVSRPAGMAATPQMPWEFKEIGKVRFASRYAPLHPADVDQVVAGLRDLGRGAFLITTQTESEFISQTAGFATDWDARFRAALSADPALRLVYSGPQAAVYQARLPASAPRAAAGAIAAAPSRSTIWSPIGIAALIAALLLLGSREFIRVCVPSRGRLLTPLALLSLPVLALLLCAVAERFVVLS
jgi:hypothetical protein